VKDALVYDGAGWQSLKGPPGPSTPSANAGNIVRRGTDGLLYAPSIVESGVWTPEGFWPEALEQYEVRSSFGSYTKAGSIVHVAGVLITNANDISTLPLAISGLPYPTQQRTAGYQFGTAASDASSPENVISAALQIPAGSFSFNVLRWLQSESATFVPDNAEIAFSATYMTD
jgi:hypothetical protein